MMKACFTAAGRYPLYLYLLGLDFEAKYVRKGRRQYLMPLCRQSLIDKLPVGLVPSQLPSEMKIHFFIFSGSHGV